MHNLSCGLDTVHHGHSNVHYDHIGSGGKTHSLGAVAHGTNDFHLRVGINKLRERLPNQSLIFSH